MSCYIINANAVYSVARQLNRSHGLPFLRSEPQLKYIVLWRSFARRQAFKLWPQDTTLAKRIQILHVADYMAHEAKGQAYRFVPIDYCNSVVPRSRRSKAPVCTGRLIVN